MKNRDLIKQLLDINLDAEVTINLANNFDYGNEDFSISCSKTGAEGENTIDATSISLTPKSVFRIENVKEM